MPELQKIEGVKLMGIWHAGAYSTGDILREKIVNKDWAKALERSMYYAYDFNFFGTEFHRLEFIKNLELDCSQ